VHTSRAGAPRDQRLRRCRCQAVELGLVCGELVTPQEQEKFFRLIQEINQLLLPGALPRGESSASAAQAVRVDLPGSAAPLRPMFDLNVEPNLVDDAPQSPALSPVPNRPSTPR